MSTCKHVMCCDALLAAVLQTYTATLLLSVLKLNISSKSYIEVVLTLCQEGGP